jgi:Tfp pilus assembly protein PilE
MYNRHNDKKYTSGFSLIELSIFFIISGILFGLGINVYDHYRSQKMTIETQNKIETIARAFSRYYTNYGRYPCPARSNVATTSPDFGVSFAPTSCDSAAAVPGGIAVSSRSVDHDNNPVTPNVTLRILVGSVPFVDLRDGLNDAPLGFSEYDSPFPISANDTIDAYGSRLTYAITDLQGSANFLEGGGAIIIRDEFGNILSDNADYLILSHGQDRKGAVTIDGGAAPTACTGTATDVENCDGDFNFVDSIRYETAANYFDDQLIYRDWMAFFLWDTQEVAPEHIYNLNAGNVGVGLTWPKQRLHVSAGNAMTPDDLLTQEICDHALTEDENIAGTDCFSADYIAGITMPVCPSGQIAIGVGSKQMTCVPLYNASGWQNCPPGQFITGFIYNTATGTLTLSCAP